MAADARLYSAHVAHALRRIVHLRTFGRARRLRPKGATVPAGYAAAHHPCNAENDKPRGSGRHHVPRDAGCHSELTSTALAPIPAFACRDGVLHAEAVPLPQLAAMHGTPLYVYSRRALTESWQRFAGLLAGTPHRVHYAVKANGSLALLQVLAQMDAGFDIVSAGELARVLRAGGDPRKVVFSGVGKRSDELHAALDAGIGCFNVESEAELRRLNALALARKQRAPVALRINPDVAAHTHPHIATGHGGAKFGVELAKAERVAVESTELPGIQLTGLACHIGSQISSIEPYREAATRLMTLVECVRARGIMLQHLDFGGGFGVRYHDEPPLDTDALIGELRVLTEARGLALHIEPGRAIVASAGVLLTRVEYVKTTRHGRLLIVDAGMTELLRPALYDAWHEIRDVAPRATAKAQTCDVVGPVCESADFLGRARRLTAGAGDFLAVMDTGAYGMSMASSYNTRPRVAEVLVDGTEAHLIRRRETLDDLVSHEILL